MSLKRPEAGEGGAPATPTTNPFAAGAPIAGASDDEAVESQIASALGEDDDEQDDEGSSRGALKWVIAIIAVIVVVALLAGAIWLASKPKNKKIVDYSNVGNSSSIGGSDGDGTTAKKVSAGDGFMSELGIPEYYQKPSTDMTQDEEQQASSSAIEAAPANAAMALPSSKSNPNLTSDPAKAFNDDGTINPDYSYITMDNTMPLIYDDLQRLVNPVYGQWTALQQVDRVDVDGMGTEGSAWSALSTMFAQEPASSVAAGGDAAKSVISGLYADWNKDFYGGKFAGKTYHDPIVGVVKAFDCDFNVQGAEEDTVTCYAQVEYNGKTTGSNVVKDSKNLTMNYKVNYDDSLAGRRLSLVSVTQD